MSTTQPTLTTRPGGDIIPAYFISSSALLAIIESSTEDKEVRTMLLDSLNAHQITLTEFFYDVLTGHCLHLLPGAGVAPSVHGKVLEVLAARLVDKNPGFTAAVMHYSTEAAPFVECAPKESTSMSDRLANHLLDLVFGMEEINEEQALSSVERLFDLVAWSVTRIHSDVSHHLGKEGKPLLVTQNGKYLWIMEPPPCLWDGGETAYPR